MPGEQRCVLFLPPPKSSTAHPFALREELSSPHGKGFVTRSSVIVSMSPSLWAPQLAVLGLVLKVLKFFLSS